jgi:alkylation response protein AidB-like acyl-CoA dehydrogenase
VDFSLSEENIAYRDNIRRIIAETVTPEVIERMHTTGTFDAPELNLALAGEGLLQAAVPGMGTGDPIELWILCNEIEKAGAPIDGLAIALMIAGVVNAVGTDEQKDRILPSIISGEALVCMGYSEPDYGSDVASVKTRAVRDGDEWVINGAKMWTTMAHKAHRPRPAGPQGPDDVHHADGHPGHHGRPGAHDGHRAHQRHLLRRRARG